MWNAHLSRHLHTIQRFREVKSSPLLFLTASLTFRHEQMPKNHHTRFFFFLYYQCFYTLFLYLPIYLVSCHFFLPKGLLVYRLHAGAMFTPNTKQARWKKIGKGLKGRTVKSIYFNSSALTASKYKYGTYMSFMPTIFNCFHIHTQSSSPHFETIHNGREGKPWRKCHCTTPLQSLYPSPSPLPLLLQFFSSPEQASPQSHTGQMTQLKTHLHVQSTSLVYF